MSPSCISECLNQLVMAGVAGLEARPGSPDHRTLLELMERGYPVKFDGAVARFVDDQDALVPALIRSEARCSKLVLAVQAFLELGSTNDHAVALARAGAPEGSLIVAETQAAGKGRKGRGWFSVPGASICSSLVLRPGRPIEEWPLLGLASGTALVRALVRIQKQAGVTHAPAPELKWPNDVLLGGKKVAGILLESTAGEGGNRALVIGVGVNVRVGSLPPGLADCATTIESEWKMTVSRRHVLVCFLEEFESQYEAFLLCKRTAVLEAWKAHSPMCTHTQVWVAEDSGRWPAVTSGLDEQGALRVRMAGGKERILLAADVSIRLA